MEENIFPTGTNKKFSSIDAHALRARLDEYFSSQHNGEHLTVELPISMLLEMEKSVEKSYAEPDEKTLADEAERQKWNKELGNHLRRVAAYAKLLAQKLGMSDEEVKIIKQISPMHDIGKGAIPESILHKPAKLTVEEFEIMKTHTQWGYDLLKDCKMEMLQLGAMVAVQHQEKFDGSGYPNGLKGEEIHIYSRITTVADVFDALASERSYKKAWDIEAIVQYFQCERGGHFDPLLVDVLLENLPEILEIKKAFAEKGE